VLSQFAPVQKGFQKFPEASQSSSPRLEGSELILELHTLLEQSNQCTIHDASARIVSTETVPSHELRQCPATSSVAMPGRKRPLHSGADHARQSEQQHVEQKTRKRAHVAEGWLGCPMGTLPTCIAGVGELPELTILGHAPANWASCNPTTVKDCREPLQLSTAALECQSGQQQPAGHHPHQVQTNLQQQKLQEVDTVHDNRVANPLVVAQTGLQCHSVAVSAPGQRAGVPIRGNIVGACSRPADEQSLLEVDVDVEAQRNVLKCWDDMLNERNKCVVEMVEGMVQELDTSNRRIEIRGDDREERNAVELNASRTTQPWYSA
jgi:hypothetical protein